MQTALVQLEAKARSQPNYRALSNFPPRLYKSEEHEIGEGI